MTPSKRCTRCRLLKALSEFYASSGPGRSPQNRCKACHRLEARESARRRYRERIDQERERARIRYREDAAYREATKRRAIARNRRVRAAAQEELGGLA